MLIYCSPHQPLSGMIRCWKGENQCQKTPPFLWIGALIQKAPVECEAAIASKKPNMSNPGAGFEYPRQEVSWLKRDVLLFANSIGCTADELHFLYVNWLPSQLPVRATFRGG
jgi:hypothetical protein